MAATFKTPGVYIKEVSAFPNSVVAVETAIPAFIGYTKFAEHNGEDVTNKPIKISSLMDYINIFGGGSDNKFTLGTPKPGDTVKINLNGKPFSPAPVETTCYQLYNALKFFYLNGGGDCFIVSVGAYGTKPSFTDLSGPLSQQLGSGTLVNEHEPTMVLIPDGVLLDENNYHSLMEQMLAHCAKMQNRVAIFDVFGGNLTSSMDADIDPVILAHRNGVGENDLNYGITYFPWVETTVIQDGEITFANINGNLADYLEPNDSTVAKLVGKVAATIAASATDLTAIPKLHNALVNASPNYNTLVNAITKFMNIMPVAPAMAGVYTAVDNSRGVWKAPANVSLDSVVKPTVNVNDDQQGNLNVDAETGKSINAIRAFPGHGVVVWGARTLDGNSNDWKYVSVRRTMIMLEQSVKLAARPYVFEANDANTWATVKSMIENFLNDIWKQGGLQGAKPDDAYQVLVGLGKTMTGEDLLEGIMRVTVLVAMVHPAEFIELTFEQLMPKS